jgi:uncharacterized membrane protein
MPTVTFCTFSPNAKSRTLAALALRLKNQIASPSLLIAISKAGGPRRPFAHLYSTRSEFGEAPAMNIPIYAVALGIGFVAGLRTFTAPAVLSWAAYLRPDILTGCGFLGSKVAVALLTLLALAEYVGDLLPKTPNRTAPGPLIFRIISGGLCGACLLTQPWIPGALIGGISAVMGAYAGYNARRKLVEKLKVKDAMIAIPEDLFAISMACLLVYVGMAYLPVA